MEKLTINGRTFDAVPNCDFSDYGGDGSVARANLNVLRAQFNDRMIESYYSDFEDNGNLKDERWFRSRSASDFDGIDLIILKGGYSSQSAYLATDCEEYADIFAALSDYPVLDEDELSEVEMQWTDEAITACVSDVGRALRKYGEEIEDRFDALSQEQSESLIRQAMEKASVYATMEYSSAYISADDVAPTIAKILGDCEGVAGFMFEGEFVAVTQYDNEETSDEFGRVDSMFKGLPTSSTAAYVAAWDKLNHYKGAQQ